MQNSKRIVISTLSGIFFGLVCLGLASGSSGALPWPVMAQIISSRTLMGFAIGMSCCYIGHWSIHGLLMGLLFSLPISFSGLMAPDHPEFSKAGLFFSTLIIGGIYGFLTELIVSKLFKAKISG